MTYHSRDQLDGLLEAVRADQRLVVVDNASGADDVDDVVSRFPQGRLVDGRNSGFAVAANRGAQTSLAEFCCSPTRTAVRLPRSGMPSSTI